MTNNQDEIKLSELGIRGILQEYYLNNGLKIDSPIFHVEERLNGKYVSTSFNILEKNLPIHSLIVTEYLKQLRNDYIKFVKKYYNRIIEYVGIDEDGSLGASESNNYGDISLSYETKIEEMYQKLEEMRIAEIESIKQSKFERYAQYLELKKEFDVAHRENENGEKSLSDLRDEWNTIVNNFKKI